MNELDSVTLNFSPHALLVLNVLLAFIIFGIALDLRWRDFTRIVRSPKSLAVGLTAQLLLLPAITLVFVLMLEPAPGLALGLIVVAACPGGSVSNFFAARAGGNVALSVSMSALSSLSAFVMTPLSIAFWGRLYPPAHALQLDVGVDFWHMLTIVVAVLIMPTALGCWLATCRPAIANVLRNPLRRLSTIIFFLFVFAAFVANWSLFLSYFHDVVGLVASHNMLALLVGYGFARLWRLSSRDCKTVSIEVGIQNTALGLTLILTFFDGIGSMALVAGMWGVWHLLSGFVIAHIYRRSWVPANA